jgi:hypothetical protein
MVRGSMRSWTWSETVGTSKEVCSALPAQTESRIEMGIVIVGLARSDGRIGALSDEADRRIVYPGFRFVIVLLDRTFAARFFILWWSFFLAGHGA